MRLAYARHTPGTEGYGVVRISTEQRKPGNAPAGYPFVTVCYRLLPLSRNKQNPRQTAVQRGGYGGQRPLSRAPARRVARCLAAPMSRLNQKVCKSLPLSGVRGRSPCKGRQPARVKTHCGLFAKQCEARSRFARSDMRDPPSPRLRRTRCTVYSTE